MSKRHLLDDLRSSSRRSAEVERRCCCCFGARLTLFSEHQYYLLHLEKSNYENEISYSTTNNKPNLLKDNTNGHPVFSKIALKMSKRHLLDELGSRLCRCYSPPVLPFLTDGHSAVIACRRCFGTRLALCVLENRSNSHYLEKSNYYNELQKSYLTTNYEFNPNDKTNGHPVFSKITLQTSNRHLLIMFESSSRRFCCFRARLSMRVFENQIYLIHFTKKLKSLSNTVDIITSQNSVYKLKKRSNQEYIELENIIFGCINSLKSCALRDFLCHPYLHTHFRSLNIQIFICKDNSLDKTVISIFQNINQTNINNPCSNLEKGSKMPSNSQIDAQYTFKNWNKSTHTFHKHIAYKTFRSSIYFDTRDRLSNFTQNLF